MAVFKEIENFIPLKESLIGEAIPLIHFPKNSTTLEVKMTDKLEQLVQFLKANPNQ
mgnify:CR=1 FL=1